MNRQCSRKTAQELQDAVAAYITGFQGDLICARQIWYEGLEGHGIPTPEEVAVMEHALGNLEGWKPVGAVRYEKFGVQHSFQRIKRLTARPLDPGRIMVQHLFRVGCRYKAPDGRVFQVVLSEVYNLRCFEVKDGKLVGGMVKIHPASGYAQSLVEC